MKINERHHNLRPLPNRRKFRNVLAKATTLATKIQGERWLEVCTNDQLSRRKASPTQEKIGENGQNRTSNHFFFLIFFVCCVVALGYDVMVTFVAFYAYNIFTYPKHFLLNFRGLGCGLSGYD